MQQTNRKVYTKYVLEIQSRLAVKGFVTYVTIYGDQQRFRISRGHARTSYRHFGSKFYRTHQHILYFRQQMGKRIFKSLIDK